MFGWKQWDIHLAKFKGKQINILEVGVYKGDALEKFAQVFLDSEPSSHYYGIDTWEGSPEYVGIDFKEIEKKTLEKKQNSPSKARIHLIKQESTLALPMLLSKGIEFDIIFIDASHVAKDVLYDSVICMRLLKDKGVLIFDDYLWEKLEPSLFTPKPAIDSILEIYKDIIDVLYVGYQVIIQKVPPKFNAKKTAQTIISGFSDLLNKFWYENRARIILEIENQQIEEIQFHYKKKESHEDDTLFKTLKTIPLEIIAAYVTDELKDIKEEIGKEQTRLNNILTHNAYTLTNIVAEKIAVEPDSKLKSILTYIPLGYLNVNNKEYIKNIESYKHKNFSVKLAVIDVYTGYSLDYDKVKVFLENMNEKFNIIVGVTSIINSGKQSVSRNLLIQFLSLKKCLNNGGEFRIKVGRTGSFLNDYLLLLSSSFKNVTVIFLPYKIGNVNYLIIAKGFKGISPDVYDSILKRIPRNPDDSISGVFKKIINVFDSDLFFSEQEPFINRIISEYEENKDVILKNLNKFKILQVKRSLDVIYPTFL